MERAKGINTPPSLCSFLLISFQAPTPSLKPEGKVSCWCRTQSGMQQRTETGRVWLWRGKQKSYGTKSMLEYLGLDRIAKWIDYLPGSQSWTRTSPSIRSWHLQSRDIHPGHHLYGLCGRREENRIVLVPFATLVRTEMQKWGSPTGQFTPPLWRWEG